MISTANHQAQQMLQAHAAAHSFIHSTPALLSGLIQPCMTRTAPTGGTLPTAQTTKGSSRRKLWELRSDAACPVTGVCLHFHEVQKMAQKVGMKVDACPDYDLHCQVLHECRSRSPLAELLQNALERRFALPIQQSQRVKTTEGLAQWWDEACVGVDWAGVFWAVLTHPRCSSDLEDIVLGQVHMLQHETGMVARSDANRLKGALAEKLRLTQDLAAVQQRLQAQVTEHAATVAALQAECVRLRASAIRAATERDLAQTQWRELKTLEAEKPSHQRVLEDKQRLQAHNNKLVLRAMRRNVQMPDQPALQPSRELVSADDAKRQANDLVTLVMDLKERQVLCVGGRTSSIPVYRDVIEGRGASFTHHDGGGEDKASRLASQLQAADVIICQVGCISHDAYWRVKEHCKRTGKPCLYVEMSGRSALERALGHKVPASQLSAAA